MERSKEGEVNLFDLYFAWVKDTEPPPVFHRWSLITSVGALLGRQIWFPFGASRLFPNIFVMMVGDPGTRKSTAIKRATMLIKRAGYDTFASNKTSKEKFLIDLSGDPTAGESTYASLKRKNPEADTVTILSALNLPGSADSPSDSEPREVFIAADEFNNFMGTGNLDFQSLLGELWDWDDPHHPYTQTFKNSKPVQIFQPTVSILGGNTPQGFAACFPLESIGQGFMSRLLLVHGQETGVKIAFPPPPPEEDTQRLVQFLQRIKSEMVGEMRLHPTARQVMNSIYTGWPAMDDFRFKHYSSRRFTHLLKLCMIVAAMRCSMEISEADVYMANTLLVYIEDRMPKAVGELGKSKNAEASSKIMQKLYAATEPLELKSLWRVVSNDLDKMSSLGEVLANLQAAGKIQSVPIPDRPGSYGWLANQRSVERKVGFVRWNLLAGKEL